MASASIAVSELNFTTVAEAVSRLMNGKGNYDPQLDVITASRALFVPDLLSREQAVAVAQVIYQRTGDGDPNEDTAVSVLREAGVSRFEPDRNTLVRQGLLIEATA